jgi:IS4 transposase
VSKFLCQSFGNTIELLFKQLKQNFPLKYFLGENENAIKIQIYCALIANLLMTVIQKQLKRQLAFSNLVSFCNGQRYVFVADFGALYCQTVMKFEASHSR